MSTIMTPSGVELTPRKAAARRTFREIKPAVGMGALALASSGVCSFDGLGVCPTLEVLFLQNNSLSSWHGLEAQPALRELYLANNALVDMAGAVAQPRLERITLAGNPIASHPHYRLMCLLVFGSRLRFVDDVVLTASERKHARALACPSLTALLQLGWLLDGEARNEEDCAALLRHIQGAGSRLGDSRAPGESVGSASAGGASLAAESGEALVQRMIEHTWRGPGLDIALLPMAYKVQVVERAQRGASGEYPSTD